jgi:hypothetical protein
MKNEKEKEKEKMKKSRMGFPYSDFSLEQAAKQSAANEKRGEKNGNHVDDFN